jgi:rhodanese-related sulfurtransferase
MKISVSFIAILLIFTISLHAQNPSSSLQISNNNETPPDREPQRYREIQTEALSKIVRSSNPSIMIVDARSLKTDNGKRIPSAKPIPFNAPIENITANLPDKQAMIIVYCSHAQCVESGLLSDRLVRMGYKNIWKYPGGIEEWEQSGYKVEQGKPAAEAAAETGPKSA